jgi:VCBS repeat-containing protein
MRFHFLLIALTMLTACGVSSGDGDGGITVIESPTTPSNVAPTLLDQSFNDLYFSNSVLGNVAFSDADSLSADIVLTVTAAPTYGTITITNHATGAFSYEPTSTNALSGDSFQLKASDGQDESTSQTMTLIFSDNTGPSLTLSPNHNANNVAITSSLTLTSDDALDTSSLTYNLSAGACSGSLQVSKDNFSSCVAIQTVAASGLDRTFTITLLADLDGLSTYEFKATTDIKNTFNVAQTSHTTHSFTTARTALIVTEIGSAYYSNVLRWFEIYNPSSSVIDLSDFSFKSQYYDSIGPSVNAVHSFVLPSVAVQPGQYVVVRAQDQTEVYASNNRVVHIKDGTKYPYWDGLGYIDLIENSSGSSVDFVTFGSSATPTTGSAWSGTFVSGMPSAVDSYGKGIMRDASNSDTDDATDWQAMDWTTPGGANDITCDDDADNDGIPDCSEVSGSTFAGLPLYDWGARIGQRDIFIEVDYMDATDGGGQAVDEGIIPHKDALQMVVDSFAAQGIAIHFDVGNLHDNASGLDPADFDLGGGEEVPYFDGVTFDPADARANLYDYKRDYMDYNRIQIFHYLLFANSQNLNGSSGSSGLAEINANDLIVSVGSWGLNTSSTANTNRLVNYQASTIMHELGHNLGLLHGGDQNDNFKPNYISIMNYLYQLSGLPTIGTDEGDRVYASSNFHNGSGTCYSGSMSNDNESTTFKINYSHGNAVNFNFAAINETLGLGQIGSSNVDFDCDGDDTETSVTMPDSNGDLAGTITDHDDWSNINLLFQRGFSGSNTGSFLTYSTSNAPDESELIIERVGDDRALIAEEYAPSAEFFEALHAH